jgi:hypothetical protein
MFGAGWAAGRIARQIAKASGASDKDAKAIGRGAGIVVSIITLDASGFIDLSTLGSMGGAPK